MPEFSALLAAGRLLLAGYATVATILATACLAMQAITAFDRRVAARRRRRPPRRETGRPLFVRFDPDPGA
ncbi:MAG: hypothetical protein ACRDJN_24985 [Chloroflexota bacterium]